MSEEKNIAIEWFKEDLTKEKKEMEYYSEYKKQVIKRNEKLLNLIEKQQKEIEALEIIHNTYKEMIEENNYISKDKIKEKIEELESLSKNITMQPSIYNYEIDLLKELLEE